MRDGSAGRVLRCVLEVEDKGTSEEVLRGVGATHTPLGEQHDNENDRS